MGRKFVPKKGMEVLILGYKEEIIDTGIIREIEEVGPVLNIESLKLYPKTKTEFACVGEDEWKVLFKGPSGERCYSERSPYYTIKPKPKSDKPKR